MRFLSFYVGVLATQGKSPILTEQSYVKPAEKESEACKSSVDPAFTTCALVGRHGCAELWPETSGTLTGVSRLRFKLLWMGDRS